MNHSPKTTIHVTSIPQHLDRCDLHRLFSQYPGFTRISFHADYVFVCFSTLAHSTSAIDKIHKTTEMLAAYAKHGVSPPAPVIPTPANPILYVSIFPYFTESELLKLFKFYDGFDTARFFSTHVLVRYKSVEQATEARKGLNSTTNLFANFSIRRKEDGKKTIHVTNIKMSMYRFKVLVENLKGFVKVAFLKEYCFVVFETMEDARSAIDEIMFSSKMKAGFAKMEFTPHPIGCGPGIGNSILRVSDYPPNTSESELIEFFESYEGFMDIQFYQISCLVYFQDMRTATEALENINSATNLVAIYSKKGTSFNQHAIYKHAPSTKTQSVTSVSSDQQAELLKKKIDTVNKQQTLQQQDVVAKARESTNLAVETPSSVTPVVAEHLPNNSDDKSEKTPVPDTNQFDATESTVIQHQKPPKIPCSTTQIPSPTKSVSEAFPSMFLQPDLVNPAPPDTRSTGSTLNEPYDNEITTISIDGSTESNQSGGSIGYGYNGVHTLEPIMPIDMHTMQSIEQLAQQPLPMQPILNMQEPEEEYSHPNMYQHQQSLINNLTAGLFEPPTIASSFHTELELQVDSTKNFIDSLVKRIRELESEVERLKSQGGLLKDPAVVSVQNGVNGLPQWGTTYEPQPLPKLPYSTW